MENNEDKEQYKLSNSKEGERIIASMNEEQKEKQNRQIIKENTKDDEQTPRSGGIKKLCDKYIWGDNAELKTEKIGTRPWLTQKEDTIKVENKTLKQIRTFGCEICREFCTSGNCTFRNKIAKFNPDGKTPFTNFISYHANSTQCHANAVKYKKETQKRPNFVQ